MISSVSGFKDHTTIFHPPKNGLQTADANQEAQLLEEKMDLELSASGNRSTRSGCMIIWVPRSTGGMRLKAQQHTFVFWQKMALAMGQRQDKDMGFYHQGHQCFQQNMETSQVEQVNAGTC